MARLRFDGNLEEPPTPGQILIQIMFPDGVFSRDLSALFTFTIEDGNVLRIEENGAVLPARYLVRGPQPRQLVGG